MFFFCRSLTKEWKGFDSIGKEGRKEGRKNERQVVKVLKFDTQKKWRNCSEKTVFSLLDVVKKMFKNNSPNQN